MRMFMQHIFERGQGHIGWGMVGCEEQAVTFPLWNLSGKFVGYQQYLWDRPKNVSGRNNPKENKYFTYLPKETLGVYGLEFIPEGYVGKVYLVEGVWEAVFALSKGYYAIAVLGNNPKQLKNWLYSVPWKVIPLCQPDAAGLKLANLNKDAAIYLPCDLDEVPDIRKYLCQ